MDDKEQALTERQRYWLEHIQACEAQGLSTAQYAAANGLQARAMYGGKKALVRKGVLPAPQPRRFQRVKTASVAVDSEWRIRLLNGVLVEFSGTVAAGSLSTVLNTVARLE